MSFNYTYWGGIKLKELQKILSFWWWWFAPKKCQKIYIYIDTVMFANRFSIGRQCLFLVHQISWAFRRTGHVSWCFHTYKENSHVFFWAGWFFSQPKNDKFSEKHRGSLVFSPNKIRLQGAGALVLSLQQENGMKKSWFKLYLGKNRGYGVSSPIIFRG